MKIEGFQWGIFFFYIPCPLETLAIMFLHDFLSFVALSKSRLFTKRFTPCSATQSLNLVKQVTFCFHLLLLPTICHVSTKFSTPSFLIVFHGRIKFLLPIFNFRYSHIPSIVSHRFVGRNASVLLQVSSSSARSLSSIHCNLDDLILLNSSTLLFVSNDIFISLNT